MSTIALPVLGTKPGPKSEPPEGLSIIELLLAQQQELAAVDTFARRHAEVIEAPEQAKYYRDLIPVAAPKPGQQYAFEVDLDACSGCKACVVACHTLNGLDEEETWRSVGLLLGEEAETPMLQHVTGACHHCLDPACLNGCPVLAYEKDPVTGIVRHLDDQCIGCQYCVLKCPYDVPKYNRRKGIVRKCDMCSGRLAAGEAPGCVQGCPNQAIRVRLVEIEEVQRAAASRRFLPGAADPDYTRPTTKYRSAKPLPPVRPADEFQISPEHAHLPLIVMLVLTQLSVGAFALGQAATGWLDAPLLMALRPLHAAVALALGLLALGASTAHLGRPLYAFRAVLGLRTSWLSREILTFGLFAKLAMVYAGLCFFAPAFASGRVLNALGTSVAVVGLLGVFCSAMIYHDTRRAFWHLRRTGTKFAMSTVLLGLVTGALTTVVVAAVSRDAGIRAAAFSCLRPVLLAVAGVTGAKVLFGLLVFRHLWQGGTGPMKRTARLLVGPLRGVVLGRLVLAAVGGILLPLLAASDLGGPVPVPAEAVVLVAGTFVMTLCTELVERYLFFTAVVAPRMPGGLHHD